MFLCSFFVLVSEDNNSTFKVSYWQKVYLDNVDIYFLSTWCLGQVCSHWHLIPHIQIFSVFLWKHTIPYVVFFCKAAPEKIFLAKTNLLTKTNILTPFLNYFPITKRSYSGTHGSTFRVVAKDHKLAPKIPLNGAKKSRPQSLVIYSCENVEYLNKAVEGIYLLWSK